MKSLLKQVCYEELKELKNNFRGSLNEAIEDIIYISEIKFFLKTRKLAEAYS